MRPGVGTAAAAAVLAALAAAPLATGRPERPAETGTLALRATLAIQGLSSSRRFGNDCGPGTPVSVECFSVNGTGLVRGLGRVKLSSLQFIDTKPAGCAEGEFRVLGSPATISVAGRGTISVSIGGAAGCRTLSTVLSHTRSFSVVGGTGAYAGATGSGSVRRVAGFEGQRSVGTETWTGTLVVAGLDFDLVPPAITGAVAKTVLAPSGGTRVRVKYAVRAHDARDGTVPVTCKPRSGASFRIGRTRVACKAMDTSANVRAAQFWVTVRRAG